MLNERRSSRKQSRARPGRASSRYTRRVSPKAACMPVDALLWGLVASIRDAGRVPTEADLRGILGSGCPRERLRAVLLDQGAKHPDRPFALAIALLDRLA